MPKPPDISKYLKDARFDAYRQRVGRLLRGEANVGLLLVDVAPHYEQIGGALWWRLWSPVYEVLWEHAIVDGTFTDAYVPDDAAQEALNDYGSGRFDHYGEVLQVKWTDRDESQRLRISHFGG
ncbi:hypothetical protein WDZ16_10450 [Pseudokineococcus marinus]|uniref:Uncharacterized protein n=1 Tax=Pseudokineococcus marinus TaxID=351215 RepID=A0A849BHK3_9ACTN|nr:hypothetical protein [Pseudokineococcus marinus]NNH22620.1 hypothetical protein [Pseudokineococcus marinus]